MLKLGRTTKKDAWLALTDVDNALKGLPSSYTRVDLPVPASKQEVRKARKALHVTQRDFAITMGVSVQTVKSWESGDRSPEGPATKLIRWLVKHPSQAGQFAKI